MQDENKNHANSETIQKAYSHLIDLAKLNVKFAEVYRCPRYPSGKRESDVEHSYHLALSASELAADFYPELDVGLVTQYCLVHDLAEFYSGDVWTLWITEEDRNKKEQAEKEAVARLLNELPPHTAELLNRYEKQEELEARFVRFVDKLLPDIIHILAGEANTFKEDHGIQDVDTLENIRIAAAERLQKMFPEFQLLHSVRELIMQAFKEEMYSDDGLIKEKEG